MSQTIFWRTLTVSLCCLSFAHAATVIEYTDIRQQPQKVILTAEQARLDSNENQFMLLNMAKGLMYAVDGVAKRIVIVDNNNPAKPAMQPPPPQQQMELQVSLQERGQGPDVVGYPTTHYAVVANGYTCTDNYVSQTAEDIAHLRAFIDYFTKIGATRKQLVGNNYPHPCFQAHDQMLGQLMAAGVLMKTVTSTGKVIHEVTSIQSNAELPSDTFEIPNTFQQLTEQEMLDQMHQEFMARQQQAIPQQQPHSPPPATAYPQQSMPVPQQQQAPQNPQYRPLQ